MQIEQRIIVERSLLFAAFELRGCMSYVDSAEPQQLGRSKEDERKQKDKELGNTYSSRDLPGAPHSICNTNRVPNFICPRMDEPKVDIGRLSLSQLPVSLTFLTLMPLSVLDLSAAHLIQGIHVYTYKSRGVVGLSVTVAPGEFPEKTERYPAVGRVDGRCETFRLQPRERLVQIEVMAGIVIEQIRCEAVCSLSPAHLRRQAQDRRRGFCSGQAAPNHPTISMHG